MAVVNWSLQAYTDTAANLNARATPILEGQLAIETDTITTTPKFKIGDGVSLYSALPYFYGGASSAQNLQNVLSIGSATGGLGYNITLTTGDVLYIGNNTRSIYTPALGTTGITLDNTNSSEYIILKDAGGVDFSGTTVTMAQLGYLNGVTSSIQTQLNNKQPLDVDLTSWAAITRASGFDTFVATPSSANLASLVTDETGSGALVFGTQPTFTQWITVPRIYGGTGVNDGIDFYSTSGNGTAGSVAHRFRGGNNGAVTILEMFNNGNFRIPNNRTILAADSGGTDRSLLVWSSGDNISIIGRPGTTDINLNPTSGGIGLYVKSGGDGGIGVASPVARWHIIKTTEQLRVGYDTSNYYSTTVGSTGNTIFSLNAATSGASVSFSFNIPTNTGQTASTEISNFKVNGATKTWLAGAITNQRWNYFTANTAAFASASTITNSYGLYVEAATAGANATITNNWAAGFSGNVELTSSGTTKMKILSGGGVDTYIASEGAGSAFGSLSAHNVVFYRGNSLKLTLQSSSFLFSDSYNIEFNTTTGSKIGTATTQKLAFWNAAPIVQPTTAVTAATFVANTSGIANDTATFDGYTIGQVVKALRNCGLLA